MNRLTQLRIDRGLDRRQVAAQVDGVSHETIRRLERGLVAEPNVNTLRKLGEFFDVPPSSLLQPAVFAAPDIEPAA